MSTATKVRKARKLATPDEVRAWGIENGFEVGTRGRLSDELRDAFNKAKRGGKAYAGSHPETQLVIAA